MLHWPLPAIPCIQYAVPSVLWLELSTYTASFVASYFCAAHVCSTLKDIQHLFDRDHRGACPSLIVSANEVRITHLGNAAGGGEEGSQGQCV
jgi:hypothetical protein